MTLTDNTASGGAPQPRYEVRFDPQKFEDDVNSSGKRIGFQEVWRELPDGWHLAAHIIKDDVDVYVRKAFARRGRRADGSWEQSVAVGTFDVVAVESSTTEEASAPKTGDAAADYLTSQYGWAAKKRA